uniref:Uncharacterized protein n=1 Tax=Tanacetum cinerariifolium TaxID=118510 RepID=A0A6L2NBC6_TANCI|nr:hypothetical protein [Tanacetum cinerariifolium]
MKFLRSLPFEWNAHVVVWRNKADLDTMSIDDLYNNFKIVEQEVNRTVTSSSTSGSQNMAFLLSPGSTNEVDTANIQVSIVSTPVSSVSSHDNTANLSDATVYAFLANQPNGSHLVHEDLEQIHEDDLEEIDLKWQLGLSSMRARRYFQRTGKKITINGSDTAGYDKTKVECFNCYKMRYFASECRSPRNQESRPRNQDSSRKTVNVEDTSSKAMVAIDEACFDWSYMAEDEVPINMALMAFLDSEVNSVNTANGNKVTSADGKQRINDVKSSACWVWRPKIKVQDHVSKNSGSYICKRFDYVDPKGRLKSEHDGGYVAFGGGAKGGKITSKGTIRTGKLDFEDAYFFKELQFNLFSVSQMCDKKNNVLSTDTKCFVLSSNFKLADESQVLLKVPRKNNMYSFDMKNIVPQKDLTCLLAKATNDESMLWHRRLGHINFKNINTLVKDNLVRGLPSKHFENDQTCVACLKGKQHKVFFLATKDETSRILKSFITEIESLVEKKVKIIRCDNEIEFKNRVMNEFYEVKGIKREYSVAGTPQQNKAEAVNTACYVQNKVLVVKPHFKTPYELFKGRSHALSFIRPFGCHVTILNTLDQLGKFDEKLDEGIFVGYSTISKAFRVYNTRSRKVEENLHITFLENKPMIVSGGPEWLFDIDALLKSMNYAPVSIGTNSNDYAGKGASFDAASESDNQERPSAERSTKTVNTAGPVNTATPTYADYVSDPLMPNLEDTRIFDDAYDDKDEGTKADYNHLETGHRQEEGINYDEVFAHVARIEAIRLFLAYASFMDFTVYQMDVKSAFLYGTIEEEVYVSQPPCFVDPEFPDRVYKVEKALYGLHRVLRAWSMIGLLMYLTSSKPDIMFVMCTCSRFQVQPKVSHMHDVKRIFRYLKGQPTLGLWYPKDTPLELIAYSNSNYADARLDRKSTTRGCQFLGNRLISWQCKKQTIMANSITEAEYIVASNCYGQVPWL